MKTKEQTSYKNIESFCHNSTWLCLLDNKVATLLVYYFQHLPITANFISLLSFVLVLFADYFLLVLSNKYLFLFFLIAAYTFDNVDGIWARLKKQTTDFGKIFDLFLDESKDFLIDFSLVIFYFDNLYDLQKDPKPIIILASLYFIIKSLFYLIRRERITTNIKNAMQLTYRPFAYGGAEKYLIVYPLATFNFYLFLTYIIGHLLLYFMNIFICLHDIFSKGKIAR